MHRVEPNPALRADLPLENSLPQHLKALIVTVCIVAAAAFGFWMAGLAGLAIGAVAGAGIGFIATLLEPALPIRREPVVDQADEIDIHKIRMGALKDPAILWVTGTRSPTLALMLAIHRLGKLVGVTDTPAFVAEDILKDRAICPLALDYWGTLQKECINFTVIPALRDVETPYDLEAELQKARTLPGGNLGNNRLNMDCFLDMLELTIGRALQYGMTDEQKNALKDHLRNSLIPTFESVITLYDQMALFPENRGYIDGVRRRMAQHPGDPVYVGMSPEQFQERRERAEGLLELFDQIEPIEFTEDEQDLIDHPCPLVFASTTLEAEVLDVREFYGRPGQLTVDRPLFRLGEDLQIVYTNTSNVDRIARILGPLNVEVRDLKNMAN